MSSKSDERDTQIDVAIADVDHRINKILDDLLMKAKHRKILSAPKDAKPFSVN